MIVHNWNCPISMIGESERGIGGGGRQKFWASVTKHLLILNAVDFTF